MINQKWHYRVFFTLLIAGVCLAAGLAGRLHPTAAAPGDGPPPPPRVYRYIGQDATAWETAGTSCDAAWAPDGVSGSAAADVRGLASLAYATYLGGGHHDEGWSVALGPDGAVYVAGVTQSQDFPWTPPDTTRDDRDVFVAKFDANGAPVYVTIVGGTVKEDGAGNAGDEANAIAVDALGNAYVGGETFAVDFPVLNAWQPTFAGYEDAYLFKLDPQGALVFSTYIGGSRGEEVNDMQLDAAGRVYLGGEVYSDDYPLLNPWSSTTYGSDEEDGFVTIFSADGQMLYSTLVGASDRDQIFRIAVTADGVVYGAGMTSSRDFPTVNAFQTVYGGDWDDGFVFKLDPWTNTMHYATLLGGSGRDEVWGLDIDDQGAAYVAGTTTSSNFPTVNPLQGSYGGEYDAFVAKLAPAGNALLFATYYGGSQRDWAWDLQLDSGGNIYVTGDTESPNFPTEQPLQGYRGEMDGFLLVLDPTHARRYASYLGGGDDDRGWGLAVDAAWQVHVVGGTASRDFPIVGGAQTGFGGRVDGFLARFEVLPAPTPTPPPTPTPVPHAKTTIGPTGGSLTLSYPGHTTELTVPAGAVAAPTTFELTYEARAAMQGALQGLDHFFALAADAPLAAPVELALTYAPGPVIAESVELYRLAGGQWITTGITVQERRTGYLAAEVTQLGSYGLLGQSHRLYAPLVLRP